MVRRKHAWENRKVRADCATVAAMVRQVATHRPDVRRECVEFLQKTVSLSPKAIAGADGEIALALWDELEYDLSGWGRLKSC